MKQKKWILLLGHGLVLTAFLLAAMLFSEEILQFKQSLRQVTFHREPVAPTEEPAPLLPVEAPEDAWFRETPLIYHAGGEILGDTYTNSREAVMHTLSKGEHFIEIDLAFTSDGHLVCVYAWGSVDRESRQLTLEEFRQAKVRGRFTPLTAEELLQIMKENPRMRLVVDTQDDLYAVVETLVALAEGDPDIPGRFILQLRGSGNKEALQRIWPFADEQFLMTTYSFPAWSLDIARVCSQERICVISAPYGMIPEEDAALLRELGYTLYESPVNRVDYGKKALERGISGFYTDCLSWEDLLREYN